MIFTPKKMVDATTPDLSALYFRKNLIIHNQPLIRYFLRFDRTNSLL